MLEPKGGPESGTEFISSNFNSSLNEFSKSKIRKKANPLGGVKGVAAECNKNKLGQRQGAFRDHGFYGSNRVGYLPLGNQKKHPIVLKKLVNL